MMKLILHIIILLLLFPFASDAINRIKVVTIGGGANSVNIEDCRNDPQKIVNRVIRYWEREFSKVMIHQPDLIVLTEACDRPGGLSVKEQFDYYKIRKNQVWDYFASVAKENECYIAFGMKHEKEGKWWNSCIVLDRRGNTAGIHDKNFPTIQEMNEIEPSDKISLIECDFGKVACAVCFDLNFDELRDQYAALQPDIILFPSMYHGGLEQSKWAYSCRAYFVCSYGFITTPSEIRNPLGEIIASSTNYYNYAVASINLDYKLVHLDNNWQKLTDLKKKYGEKVSIIDPGQIGAVLITSEHDKISSDDMVKEFDMLLLDEYFNHSRNYRQEKLEINNYKKDATLLKTD